MEDVGKSIAELKGMIQALHAKVDQRFLWMMGIQFATLLAVIGGMFGIIATLLRVGRP